MIIKQLIDEDFTNYFCASMYIAFGNCTWKCGKELCHNKDILNLPDINIDIDSVIKRYLNNSLTESIVFGGLEPFDSFNDIVDFIKDFRLCCENDIVIYSGYNEDELKDEINELKKYKNITIKFGRYIPDQKPHFDEVLGVNLASDNQYGKVIS